MKPDNQPRIHLIPRPPREHPIDRAARLGREVEGDAERRFRTPDEQLAYLWARTKRRAA